MTASANLLAVSPNIRTTSPEWSASRQERIERGFEWPDHDAARALIAVALRDLQHTRRDILTLRETMAFGGTR